MTTHDALFAQEARTRNTLVLVFGLGVLCGIVGGAAMQSRGRKAFFLMMCGPDNRVEGVRQVEGVSLGEVLEKTQWMNAQLAKERPGWRFVANGKTPRMVSCE